MIPVVISGGSGTRLWPVSRTSYPKQFCEFYDKSFLTNTIERVTPLGEKPYLLTVESMRAMTLRVLKEVNLQEDHLICEPMGKNTAPAIALLCHIFDMQGSTQKIVGIFPADHLITDSDTFYKIAKKAEQLAEINGVVTFGIEPKYPATGYGYIEVEGGSLEANSEVLSYKVKQFCEKPDLKKAQEFVDSGRHFWNSGIFIFKVSAMIENFKEYMPELWQKISQIKNDLSNAKTIYANLTAQSIDYGIMEKLENQIHIPTQMGWSDVGSWDEMARIAHELPDYRLDSHANVFSEDAANNFVFSINDKVVGLVGVKNLIVVDTPDALLVAQKGHSENVKNIVTAIREAGLPEGSEQKFEIRPWGKFEIIRDEEHYKSKKITVDPGAKLSYQSHQQRAEHWVIISGEAQVTIDDNVQTLKPGQSITIPQGAKHRIHNTGREDLIFIEVQTGSYFGEDDIVRFEDEYKRV
ncbi:MAG: mannose-1-phosphate guanylyltransferase/mannose-6-phosphate isomerase [Bdellovibrionales bacterium]|nr:mannose-1-phosphate guanylyltransferase/mannose-6-phosphate isomerase [Bdellovibrionales bacterium]